MWIAFIIFLILYLLDQFTKYYVEAHYTMGSSHTIIPHVLTISYSENKGMAWSLFSDSQITLVIISIIGAIVLLFSLYKFSSWKESPFFSFSLTLAFTGCVGNLFDRAIAVFGIDGARGGVIDMIQFKPFDKLCNLFGLGSTTFNLADTYLVIGVICIMIDIMFLRDRRNEKKGIIKRKKLKRSKVIKE
ncbi:MAG: signal peptidase II [Acholeplasmatales bacterium]|nr:signal peptidase II [Acholeplasmatales bacterium]